jgi:hypothetical protein
MTTGEGGPRRGSNRVDEYTHCECSLGSTTEDRRHPVCANTACNHEWVEALSKRGSDPLARYVSREVALAGSR